MPVTIGNGAVDDRDDRDDPLARGLELLPEVNARWRQFESTVWSSELDPVVLELCRLRISALLRDSIGSSIRSPAARRAGLTEALVAALPNWPVSAEFEPDARAALAIAELFVIDAHAVTDEMCAELLATLTEAEATALTMGIAFFDATSRARVALASVH